MLPRENRVGNGCLKKPIYDSFMSTCSCRTHVCVTFGWNTGQRQCAERRARRSNRREKRDWAVGRTLKTYASLVDRTRTGAHSILSHNTSNFLHAVSFEAAIILARQKSILDSENAPPLRPFLRLTGVVPKSKLSLHCLLPLSCLRNNACVFGDQVLPASCTLTRIGEYRRLTSHQQHVVPAHPRQR